MVSDGATGEVVVERDGAPVVGERPEAHSMGTKTCPRCGARLFSDMPVCYGCLYDFGGRSASPPVSPDDGGWEASASSMGPSAGVARGVDAGSARSHAAGGEGDGATHARSERVPAAEARASTPPGDPDDTVDLSCVAGRLRVAVRVMVGPCEVTCPLSTAGLTVGRARDNDLVIHDRTVSRHHLRLLPDAAGALVIDQGATNPALVDGRRMPDSLLVPPGSVIGVGGARLIICDDGEDLAGEVSETPCSGIVTHS